MHVGLVATKPRYPEAPFNPSEEYPEYPFHSSDISPHENGVYAAVREAFRVLGLDREHYGTPEWNPLGRFVGEGSRIVIKPNLVNHANPLGHERMYFDALVTHASVIRPLIDYVHIATRGVFTIVIADLPIQSADFSRLVDDTGLDRLIDFAGRRSGGAGRLEVLDLRDYQMVSDASGAILGFKKQRGDAGGYVTVDLGPHSNLVPLDRSAHLYRSLDYESQSTVQRHRGAHKYVFSRTILDCDLLINVPKLKVHRKAGVTLSLKNLVGAIGDKSCLPHYRQGAPDTGGDEFPVASMVNALRGRYSFPLRRLGRIPWRLLRPLGLALLRLNRAVHRSTRLINVTGGDWHGNDTTWRMVHDLNCAMFHADCDGALHDTIQRKYLTVVDAVVGGEGEGPLEPTPVQSGFIAVGTDPIGVDLCCTRLMGLDWRKIPLYARYDPNQRYRFSAFTGAPEDVEVLSLDDGRVVSRSIDQLTPVRRFEPAPGWKHHIELELPPHSSSPPPLVRSATLATPGNGTRRSDRNVAAAGTTRTGCA
jgi:uncharacterized protein (DUF362 family)